MIKEVEHNPSFKERLAAFWLLRFETPEHNRLIHQASFPLGEIGFYLGQAEVTGQLPKEGPALIYLNHDSWKDPLIIHWLAIVTAKRTIRTWSRRTLVEPQAQENPKAETRRTIRSSMNRPWNELAPHQKLIRQLAANFCLSFNPIIIDLDGPNPEAFEQTLKELKAGRMVASFIQGTRAPALDLLDALPGVAVLIARYFPKEGLTEVPIIPVGIAGGPKVLAKMTIRIGEAFNYSQIPSSEGKPKLAIIKNYLVERLAPEINDPARKAAWLLHQRGLSREEIEEIKGRNPDLASAAALSRRFPRLTIDELKMLLEETDRQAIF